MNLIEQLGGYEKAKEKMDDICHTLDNSELLGGGDAREGLYERLESIDKALLEYRRQHNIFEVGDKVVYKPSMVQGVIFTVIGFDDFGWMKTEAFFEGFDHPKRFSEDPPFSDVRHATDEEIKAGKRLEVESEN